MTIIRNFQKTKSICRDIFSGLSINPKAEIFWYIPIAYAYKNPNKSVICINPLCLIEIHLCTEIINYIFELIAMVFYGKTTLFLY